MTRGALALAALLPALAAAAPEDYAIDRQHTFPAFEVRHLGISTQRGRFDKTTGRIRLDREAGTGEIEIVVETGSISTGSEALDETLRGEDFFDVRRHPRMTFRAKRVEFEAGLPRRAPGELTLLGVTRPVTLAIDRFACTQKPFVVVTRCGADVGATISRSAFGMRSYAAFIADDVKLEIQVEAVRTEAAPNPADAPSGG